VSRLRFFAGEAWEYFLRGRGASFSSVLALTAVLFLLGLVLLVTHNVRALAGRLEARKGLTVFLAEGIGAEQAEAIRRAVGGYGEVASARMVDRDAALAEIEEDLGGMSVAPIFGENPLPFTFVVTLTPAAAARSGALQALAADIRALDWVEDVVYGDEFIEALDRNLHTLYTANLAVGILAALCVFVVLLTTLRLVFLSRRETVRILKMVGATDAFIRTPFLFLGALQAAFAAALALATLAAARAVFEAFLPGVRFLPAGWIFLFLLGAVLFGGMASIVSVEPALRRLETERADVVR
jgi:cell division transport system permease protein